ncbi:hypothetical protein DPEC_G00119870 [Dallia pectoralis]|uniref:Uncharacterized protein n=1 Tax=Dallia pectoralis TaxID=75939 RepID=A0ACC2GPG9_DALPE|nr:hypothetical protein DPEC_G00119870 [Dallia pectoralis]
MVSGKLSPDADLESGFPQLWLQLIKGKSDCVHSEEGRHPVQLYGNQGSRVLPESHRPATQPGPVKGAFWSVLPALTQPQHYHYFSGYLQSNVAESVARLPRSGPKLHSKTAKDSKKLDLYPGGLVPEHSICAGEAEESEQASGANSLGPQDEI